MPLGVNDLQKGADFMAKQAKRNAQGAGTIRQRPAGRWDARYTLGRDPGTGKQVQKSIYGSTQAEVRKKLQAVSVDIDNGVYTEPSKMTVGQWLDIWKSEYLGGVKQTTRYSYTKHCNNHIVPAFGACKLSELKPHAIQAFYNNLQESKGLSAKTIKNLHGVFHKALAQAVKAGYIRANPADSCELPRIEKKDIAPLTDSEIKSFLTAIRGDQYEACFIAALFTGMRRSEVLGLTWDNVDFDKGLITVKRQLQRDRDNKGQFLLTSLKNNKSRCISPAPLVMNTLKSVKAKQTKDRLKAGAAWGNGDPINAGLVFTNEIGAHLSDVTLYKHYKRIVKSLGLENARFHDLRHTYAVTALRNGDDVKTVQENLGYHTAAFTLDVYGHVTEQMKKESAARMEAYIKSLM